MVLSLRTDNTNRWRAALLGEEAMATFVLVHGSWAGSVVWRELAPRLRGAGHDVYAPTSTGIGARKHLLSREINLDTHIQDVIGVIDDAICSISFSSAIPMAAW
jgi:pimeloyl-ACP methyl ester carboxylesterase